IPWILDIADNYPEVAMDPSNGPLSRHLVSGLLNVVERRACNRADALTFVSDASRELVLEKHRLRGRSPAFVVPNLPMREDLSPFIDAVPSGRDSSCTDRRSLRCVYIGVYDRRTRDFSPIL